MPPEGSNRVNRGGSWNNAAGNCRSANRSGNDPGNRNDNLGLRVAFAPAAQESGRMSSVEPGGNPVPAASMGGAKRQAARRGW